MKRYVDVKLTPEMAYAVANAAKEELEARIEAKAPFGDEKLVREGCKRLLQAWRARREA
jgi:hypothetical protein